MVTDYITLKITCSKEETYSKLDQQLRSMESLSLDEISSLEILIISRQEKELIPQDDCLQESNQKNLQSSKNGNQQDETQETAPEIVQSPTTENVTQETQPISSDVQTKEDAQKDELEDQKQTFPALQFMHLAIHEFVTELD